MLCDLTGEMPIFVEGFTSDIPHYMALADFFIGKAGPGSISEALAMRLPVIVERNAWTLAHERYNADWIEEQQVGIVLSSFSKIAEAVTELLRPEVYSRFRDNASAIRNNAVFEIPELLDKILTEAGAETQQTQGLPVTFCQKTVLPRNVFMKTLRSCNRLGRKLAVER